jgi:competence protein ComEC
MKPAVLLLLGYGAGLATGLLRFGAPTPVFIGLVLAALWGWRQPAAVWCLAILLGRGAALLAIAEEGRRCAATLPTQSISFEARVLEPVSPDARLGRLLPSGLACRGEVDARWPPRLKIAAGSKVRIKGRFVRRPSGVGRADGVLIVAQAELLEERPSLEEGLRNWLAASVRTLYGARTGTVEALVINRRGGMPPELRDRYARAGLVHILSISGFHVGVIVAWVVLLGRLAKVPRVRATLGAAAIAFGYVLFLGWPPPAARAVILLGLGAQFHLRQRSPQAIALLSITALLVLLIDPWAVLDGGAWLSVCALGGALLATRWSDRALGEAWWWRTLSASIGATLATAPITAALFGMVSIAGVLLNFVAIPLAALAVPGLLLSLLAFAILPSAAAPVAAGAGALLGLLDQVAWWGGKWDAAAIIQPTGAASAVPWLIVLWLAGWCLQGGTTRWEAFRRASLGLVAGIWLLFGLESYESIHDASSGLTLHFLDVGQGDAALIQTPAGRWVLVDAGPKGERDDAGRRVVAPFLARHRAGGIAVAIVSHAHADHLGGVPAVLDRYGASRVIEPAELVPDSLYTGFLDQLGVLGVPWQPARAGLRFELDSVHFSILHPDTSWSEWGLDLNEDSAVLLVEYHRFRALFVGDAGLHAEARLLGRVGPVAVLKVGHHGSRSATGDAWLSELSPRVAVISAGRGNRFGHPHAEVLNRLAQHGIGIWRTDLLGTITVSTDGQTMTVQGGGQSQISDLGRE